MPLAAVSNQHRLMPASDFSIYASSARFTLAGMLRFELTSALGRTFLTSLPPSLRGPQLLNLGAGNNLYPDFVNADFFSLSALRRRVRLRDARSRPATWMVDLRYPLPCPDDYWDGVFTEHTLEHLYPERVLALLREVHRTLKPGSWVRVIVPDLAKYVRYYVGQASHPLFARWSPPGAALRSVAQNHLHVSLWDAPLMQQALQDAGFASPAVRAFGEGADTRLLKDTATRAYESLYVEALKT
jgi:hypothetical protein